MLRNSWQSNSQTGSLFTGVLGFVFGLRYVNDVHMPCLPSRREGEHRFLLSYHPLYAARQKRVRWHSGLDTWHHNPKNPSNWDACHFLRQVTVCVTHAPVRSSKVATTSSGIRHERSKKNELKAFFGDPRNCTMSPWEDARSYRQPR